jgi:hypothetical protein
MGVKDLSERFKHGALNVIKSVDEILAAPDNFALKTSSCYFPAIQSTAALLKFFEDHEGVAVPQLRACLMALEAEDDAATRSAYKSFHFGSHGPFDWFPPVTFANETTGYVQEVLVSLVERWHRLMELLLRLPPE